MKLINIAFVSIVFVSSFGIFNSIESANKENQITYRLIETAKIEAETQVSLAEIKADVTKKTSLKFSVFYLLRWLLWLLSSLVVFVWILVIKKVKYV